MSYSFCPVYITFISCTKTHKTTCNVILALNLAESETMSLNLFGPVVNTGTADCTAWLTGSIRVISDPFSVYFSQADREGGKETIQLLLYLLIWRSLFQIIQPHYYPFMKGNHTL